MIYSDILLSKDSTAPCLIPYNGLNELRELLSVEPNSVFKTLINGEVSIWYWNPNSVTADDGINCVKVTTISVGRWERLSLAANNVAPYNNSLPSKIKRLTVTANRAFTVPENVTEIYVTAGAGGGGGGAAFGAIRYFSSFWQSYTVNFSAGAGGGGAGESVYRKKFTVTPGQLLQLVIGGGGVGGTVTGSGISYVINDGGDGGDTTIASLGLTLVGGKKGGKGTGIDTRTTSYGTGGAGGDGFPSGSWGQDLVVDKPPTCGGVGGGSLWSGGGGAGRGAAGGAGGDGYDAGGFSAGGGGGGGVYRAYSDAYLKGGNGGAGANGIIIIEWIIT